MTRLLESSLGLSGLGSAAAAPHEAWAHVRFGDTRTVTVALGGDAGRALAVADTLLGELPATLAASSLVISAASSGPATMLVVRASSPGAGTGSGIGGVGDVGDAGARMERAARSAGLRVDRLRGRQRDALLLTLPLAVGA
jgi:hypothetical protein